MNGLLDIEQGKHFSGISCQPTGIAKVAAFRSLMAARSIGAGSGRRNSGHRTANPLQTERRTLSATTCKICIDVKIAYLETNDQPRSAAASELPRVASNRSKQKTA